MGDATTAPTVTFLRVTGSTGADEANADMITDVYGLRGAATVLKQHYKLAADIDPPAQKN